jgi:plastocyanin
MKVRIAAASALVLLGGATLIAASAAAPADEELQDVVVEIRLEDGRLVADPNRVRVQRGQRVDWDNTLGGDVAIYFQNPGLFGQASLRGEEQGEGGLRGRREGQTRGRAVGVVPSGAQEGTYKYDIEAWDTDGNMYELDPELDCC